MRSVTQPALPQLVIATDIWKPPGVTMRRNGAYTCLVTGGFTSFAQRIAAMIGFDENRANALEIGQDHKLTGTVAEPIFGRDGKLNTLLELRQRLTLAPEQTLAVGDGANDLAMLAAAGSPGEWAYCTAIET